MKKYLLVTTAVLGIGLWAATANSGDVKQDKHGQQHGEQAFEMPKVEVNEHHKVLHDGVGTWKVVTKDWWAPGQVEPNVSYGTSSCKLILDGLATVLETETTGDQGTFKGFGITTWNTLTQKYEMDWLDIMSFNGIEKMEGTWNSVAKTMTWTAMITMPNGMRIPYKMVDTQESKDKWVTTFWMTEMDGKDRKTMEIVSTRVK